MYDFFDRDHAAAYLNGTVVRRKGRPVLVNGVDYDQNHRLYVNHSDLRDWRRREVGLINEFDFTPFKLGMYNFRVGGEIVEAAWIQRVPARRWKVGLDRTVTASPVRRDDDNVIFERMRRDVMGEAPWYCNEDMADMLDNKYPSLDEALSILGRCTRRSVAFSRNFAVTGTRKLFYRHNDQPVGKVGPDGRASLGEAYLDLREILKEDVNA